MQPQTFLIKFLGRMKRHGTAWDDTRQHLRTNPDFSYLQSFKFNANIVFQPFGVKALNVISTTDLSKIIGFTLKADFIKSLGIEPFCVTKTSTLWNEGCANEVRAKIIEKLKADMESKEI